MVVHPTTHKKVVVRHRALGWLAGFADPRQLQSPGPWELLNLGGQVVALHRDQVQVVYFVSEFEPMEALQALGATSRGGGAKQPGLWVRVRTQDRVSLDGILSSDLLELENGIWLTPLWPESRWQRAFLPRPAIQQLTAVEMIRPPRRRRPAHAQQIGLFQPEAAGIRPAREAS